MNNTSSSGIALLAEGNPWITFILVFTGSTYCAKTFCYLTTIWTFDSVNLSHYLSIVDKLGWNVFELTDTNHFLGFHFKLILNLLWFF